MNRRGFLKKMMIGAAMATLPIKTMASPSLSVDEKILSRSDLQRMHSAIMRQMADRVIIAAHPRVLPRPVGDTVTFRRKTPF